MSEQQCDFALLREFASEGRQPAFAALARRHLDLVYATALRKVSDAGGAEEIAQNVFSALARKACQFAPDDSLPAWLHKTALLESKSWLRGELRRRRREQAAAELGTTLQTPEDQPAFKALVPKLDEVLLSLREKDRTALLLRYYESHSLRDVGTAFGVSEDTARKRVQGALEKLSDFFKRRGFKTATVAATAAALQHTATSASATLLSTVVSGALQAAPPVLVGLGALVARLASLSRLQTATVCVALVAGAEADPHGYGLVRREKANSYQFMSKTQARTPFEVLILNEQNLNINRPGEWLKVGRSIAAETNRKVVLVIKDTQSDCNVAQASIWKAEHHSLASEIPFQPGSLEKTIVVDQIMVDHAEQLPALLYLALREGRILKRTNALFFVAGHEHSTVVELLKLKPLRHVPSLIKDGIAYCAYAQVIDYAMHYAFAACNETALALVQEQMSIEVVRTVESWLVEFFQRPWTQAVLNRKLAREQYVSTLYNLHTFVRYTTRLLGRAIALSSDQSLRDHYIEHLKGEINHERIIERDLEYLQEDVEYLLHYRQPNYETKAFLTVQESTLAYYQDPVLFLACPIAAEGVAAYLTQEFLACLYDCVESWGVQSPKRASHMVTSHTGFDGGEDGHWNLTILKVKEHVKTEPRLREFLGVLRTAMNALERSYDSNIEEMRLWELLCR